MKTGRFVLEGIDYETRTVAEYEALLKCERLLRRECKDTGSQGMVDIYATLAKLDEIRKGQA